MLSKDKIQAQIHYWLETSKKDFWTMEMLYKGKNYSWCLFFGHLVLEKALKGLVVATAKDYAPRIHNLRKLAEYAKLSLSEKEWGLLSEADTFSMEARYPDEKLEFYQKATKAYADSVYKPIISLYKKLCQKML